MILRPIRWRWPRGAAAKRQNLGLAAKAICALPRRSAPFGHADRATSDDDGRNTLPGLPQPRRIQTQPKVAGKGNLAGALVGRGSRALLSPPPRSVPRSSTRAGSRSRGCRCRWRVAANMGDAKHALSLGPRVFAGSPTNIHQSIAMISSAWADMPTSSRAAPPIRRLATGGTSEIEPALGSASASPTIRVAPSRLLRSPDTSPTAAFGRRFGGRISARGTRSRQAQTARRRT